MKRLLLLTIATVLALVRATYHEPRPPRVTPTPTATAPAAQLPAEQPDLGLAVAPTATCAVPPLWETPAAYPAAYPAP